MNVQYWLEKPSYCLQTLNKTTARAAYETTLCHTYSNERTQTSKDSLMEHLISYGLLSIVNTYHAHQHIHTVVVVIGHLNLATI